ncbi:MAG: MoxR family ATPase [Candidatus Pacearchaeota archaeon]
MKKRDFERKIRESSRIIFNVKKEISKVFVGQEKVLNDLIVALLCDGHVLLEGVPGIAKTLVVKSLAKVTGCTHGRIQFTVDLLPTDILGITTYYPDKGFVTEKGPIFVNFLLADEINRSPPKTQSAMIEAMQEKQVTLGKQTYPLPKPFFVMATQNPLEQSGVYPLPEAQVDRFLFKIIMGYPKREEEKMIMEKNTTLNRFEDYSLKEVTSPEEIVAMQEMVKEVYLHDHIKDFILDIVELTRTKKFSLGEYIEWGASPRATIGLFIASKANAFIEGREFVIPKDVESAAYNVLRHRIILTYKAEIQKITPDNVISEIINVIKNKHV